MPIRSATGSSPLSRGIRDGTVVERFTTRIIPALAGNTRRSTGLSSELKDHPRSRGEYFGPRSEMAATIGSSPLSRGIHMWLCEKNGVSGIIPALAGNTHSTASALTANADHPRSRGEYWSTGRAASSVLGSSPLSRGIRVALDGSVGGGGIIPALAGNTRVRPSCVSIHRDHPRSRGEYAHNIVRGPSAPGSSPLSRGILYRGSRTALPARIIPALAGNTDPDPNTGISR